LQEEIALTVKEKTLKADLVVVGAGGSGLAAAVTAAAKGLKVIVLEKRKIAGGNTVFAEGLFGADSPTQKRLLIDARPDTLFKMAMNFAHWTLNPRVLRAFIDRSGDTIRWLEEKGVKFIVPPLFVNQVPLTWHCPERNGTELIELFLKECQELGVKLIYSTSASRIIKDKSGTVSGLIAQSAGKEIRITTKSVIIGSGGYGANQKLLKKYNSRYDERIRCRGVPGASNGDGLMMALEAGCATEGLGMIQFTGPNCVESPKLTGIVREPTTVWVNKRGERFFDEGMSFQNFEAANALVRQPDAVTYVLFDESIKQESIKEGPIKMMLGGIYNANCSTLDQDLKAQYGKAVIRANTWAEIAKWIGAKPETLNATIKEYNSYCDHGHDTIFVKDIRYLRPLKTPPFYAVRCYPTFLTTIGGIKINEHMEVVDKDDQPIPGLYAVGNDAGGWESDTYDADLSGTTLGFAINSGRIAGENAAKYIRPSGKNGK
jgi:fumarate reductase flavoprotein subunit